jgi:hypothetical protein
MARGEKAFEAVSSLARSFAEGAMSLGKALGREALFSLGFALNKIDTAVQIGRENIAAFREFARDTKEGAIEVKQSAVSKYQEVRSGIVKRAEDLKEMVVGTVESYRFSNATESALGRMGDMKKAILKSGLTSEQQKEVFEYMREQVKEELALLREARIQAQSGTAEDMAEARKIIGGRVRKGFEEAFDVVEAKIEAVRAQAKLEQATAERAGRRKAA